MVRMIPPYPREGGNVSEKKIFTALEGIQEHDDWIRANVPLLTERGYDDPTRAWVPDQRAWNAVNDRLVGQGWMRVRSPMYHVGSAHWRQQLPRIEDELNEILANNPLDLVRGENIFLDVSNSDPEARGKGLPTVGSVIFTLGDFAEADSLLSLVGRDVAKIVRSMRPLSPATSPATQAT